MKFQFFCIIFPYINPGICKIKLRTLFDPSNMQKGTKIEQFFWRKIILKFSFVRWNSVGSNFLCKILTSRINFHDKWLLLMDCTWKNITHSLLKCQNPCTEAWEKLTRISHYFSLIFFFEFSVILLRIFQFLKKYHVLVSVSFLWLNKADFKNLKVYE